MRCASCGFANPEGMQFCGLCGTRQGNHCPQCHSANPSGFAFCGHCGTPLTAEEERTPSRQRSTQGLRAQQSGAGALTRPAGFAQEAERRQLTVLFCDVVGSTTLSAQLDPEEWRSIIQEYQAVCADVIQRFEGYIAQYLGDGLLIYFGYPLAHEDDAVRAVRAGLRVVTKLRELPSWHQHALQVRLGIHTGLVVVGEIGAGGRHEQLALGDTPNIAARLQGLAEPNTVLISATTARLVEGYFVYQDLGPQHLKGLSRPIAVYRVLQESGLRTRLQVARMTGLTPLVGREHEVALLLQRWKQARAGAGQVVLVNGEAGIGKSRLLHVLTERLAEEPHARLDFRCSSYHQHSALYPVIDLLQRALQFRPEDSPQTRLAKLESTFAQYGLAQAETIALFASLLALPVPSSSLADLPPQQQRAKTLEASIKVLLTVARHQPLLLLVEDLHWIDPSTLEFFSLFLAQLPTACVLVVFTARPEFVPPWPPRSHLTVLTLPRLGQHQVETMAAQVARGKALPPEVLQQVMHRTDGIPLFVEEFTKMVLESGRLTEREDRYELSSPLPSLAIPVTLYESLMARLDRLSAVKEIAQIGATLGREFSYDLIQAISPLDEATLQRELPRLVEAELLYQTGVPPRATYLFKHALIREAAYQSLLKSTRQRFHQRIAQVLAERFPEIGTTQPELLAHHYTEAGLIKQALPYWQQAGQRASQRSAYVEAVTHLTRGLELLNALPNTAERAPQELALQTALGATLTVTKGYAAPDVERAYARALALCRQVGETPQLFPVLSGLHVFHLLRAELHTARELAGQQLRLAQSIQDAALLVWAHNALGLVLFHLGEFTSVLTHLDQSIALYDPPKHRPDRTQVAMQDPQVTSLAYASWTLWYLGYPDQARKRSAEALALARELSHPFSLAFALNFASVLDHLLWNIQAFQERTETLMTLVREQGFPFWLALGALRQGWILAQEGQEEEGIRQMHRAIAAMRASGAELTRSAALAWLAEAYGKAGQVGAGWNTLAEAMAHIHKTGERYYEAELYRLKGQLTLQKEAGSWRLEARSPSPQAPSLNPQVSHGVAQEAERYFLKAIEIARQQSARSWELRAAVSLSRLWQTQGKKNEARQLLTEIYGWFTEGFETKDLQEARVLLEELT